MRAVSVLVLLLLTLFACSAAMAVQVANLNNPGSDWTVTYEGENPIFTWSANSWQSGEMYIDIEYLAGPGAQNWFALSGEKDADPLVTQTTKNGSGTTWLDWHVDILNATIDRVDVPVVHQAGTGVDATNWTTSYTHNAGYTDGFGATWIGGNTSVAPNESLYIRFRWTPTGTGTVTIRQYPTDTGVPIPEPSSMIALASGIASLGFAFLRRRSG